MLFKARLLIEPNRKRYEARDSNPPKSVSLQYLAGVEEHLCHARKPRRRSACLGKGVVHMLSLIVHIRTFISPILFSNISFLL